MSRRVSRERGELLLVFRLPENPSRYRVSVWRRLKRAGAKVLHRAIFVLPDTPLNQLIASDLAHDVENWGGTAIVYAGGALDTRSRRARVSRGSLPRILRKRRKGSTGPR